MSIKELPCRKESTNVNTFRADIACYNRKELTFVDSLRHIKDLKEVKYIELHAYCLMRNHYHLLIRTPLGNLSRAMRHINGVYTQVVKQLQAKPQRGEELKEIVQIFNSQHDT